MHTANVVVFSPLGSARPVLDRPSRASGGVLGEGEGLFLDPISYILHPLFPLSSILQAQSSILQAQSSMTHGCRHLHASGHKAQADLPLPPLWLVNL